MNAPEQHPAAEELLRHAQWIRSLARALISDDAAADDIVQETMVAALIHSPGEEKLRPWLRQVVRNFARQHHRSSGRRRAREALGQGPNGLPDPAELSERLETEQRLTRELARLDEPFRSTLMHRFYDDLQPTEIARRLGVPGGTVRWRLKRGLEILRDRLDETSGGDRSAWSLGLLPLARLDHAAEIAVGTSSAALPIWILMNVLKAAAVTSAALLVVTLGLVASGVLPSSFMPWTAAEEPADVSFNPLGIDREVLLETALSEIEPQAARFPAPAVAAHPAKTPPSPAGSDPDPAVFDARILGDGLALAGAQMVLVILGSERMEPTFSTHDGFVSVVAINSRSMAARGSVPFPASVAIHAAGFASLEIKTQGKAGSTTHLGNIDLAPGGAVSGLVLDENGAGLAYCTISLTEPTLSGRELEARRFDPADVTVPSTRTDEGGRFRLQGVPVGSVRIWGRADGYVACYTSAIDVQAGQETSGVELELEPLGPSNLVRGVVLAPNGTPIPNADLRFRTWSKATRTSVVGSRSTGSDGRFEFVMQEDGAVALTASDPKGRWGKATVANAEAGDIDLVLRLRNELMLALEVDAANGEPVTRYGIQVLEQEGDLQIAALPVAEHPAGRVEFARPTATFIVRITAPGYQLLKLGPLDPNQLEGQPLSATLAPLPGLHGRVLKDGSPVPGVSVALHSQVDEHMLIHSNGFRLRMLLGAADTVRTDDEGRFMLTPRSVGSYVVRATPTSGAASEYGPFAVAGNLSGPDVELHLGAGGAIEGRVVLAGAVDPGGTIVSITRGDGRARTQRVATDGAFSFDGLIVGPWRVERRDKEIVLGQTLTTSHDSGGERAFDDWNCTVVEGETTYFDLIEAPDEHRTFTGRLTFDGAPAEGWSAALAPSGTLSMGSEPRAPLDLNGTFSLQAAVSGRRRLILVSPMGGQGMQILTDEVDLSMGSWSRDLGSAPLIVAGLDQWSEEDDPRVVHYWKGEGDMEFITTFRPDDNGTARIEHAPAGESRLVAPVLGTAPREWNVLHELQLQVGVEQTVDLR